MIRPFNVPKVERKKEVLRDEMIVKIPEDSGKHIGMSKEHKHGFVPLWMPVLVFVFIVLAYFYCLIIDKPVNIYRAIGFLGISGFFAMLCLNKMNNKMNNKDE